MGYKSWVESFRRIRFSVSRWVDGFWGYDVFIAHRRSDASQYARALHERLKAERIASFIDQVVYGAGDHLAVATRRHVSKSTVLLMLGSPEIFLSRRPIDWVEREVQIYLESHQTDPKVIVVDFGATVAGALECVNSPRSALHPLARELEPFLRVTERLEALAKSPSEEVLAAVRARLAGRRRDRARVRLFEGIAGVLSILLLAVCALGLVARSQERLAQRNLDQALRMDSRRLSTEARRQLAAGRADLAVLLAREALAGTVPGSGGLKRPYVAEAAVALARGLAQRPLATESWRFDKGVQLATVSPDDKTLLILIEDGFAELRDVADGRTRVRWRAHLGMPHAGAFSPDGRLLLTAGQDKVAKLWDAATGREIRSYPSEGPVRSASFSRDGALIITGSEDGYARVWGVKEDRQLHRFSCPLGVQSAGFNADGKRVIIACGNGTAEGWNLQPRERRFVLATKPEGALWSTVFSPDGRLILTSAANGTLRLWNGHDGSLVRMLGRHDDRAKSALFSRDGKYIVSVSDDRTAAIWETSTGRKLQELNGHTFYVLHAEFLDQGRKVVTASWDQSVRIWQLSDDDVDFVMQRGAGGITSAAFSPTGDKFVTGSWNGGAAISSAADGQLLKPLPAATSVGAVAFSPDGQKVATAEVGDQLDWNVVSVRDVHTGKALFSLPKGAGSVGSVAFSPDGTTLLVAGDEMVGLWNAGNGSFEAEFPNQPNGVDSAAFSPHGERVVTVSSDGAAAVWDAGTRAKLVDLATPEAWLSSVAFDSAGDRVVVGDYNGDVSVYDARTGRILVSFPRQTAGVEHCEFSPGGSNIVTSLEDGTVAIWEASTGRPVAAYHVNDPKPTIDRDKDKGIYSANFSHDGTRVLLGVGDGTVRMWAPKASSYERLVANALHKRTLTKKEREEFGLK